MELTSRFLDRLRLVELITALCILASLSFLLIAYSGSDTSAPAPARSASSGAATDVTSAGAAVRLTRSDNS